MKKTRVKQSQDFREIYSQEKVRDLQKVSLVLEGEEQKGDEMSGEAGGTPAWSWHLGKMELGSRD